MKIIGPFLLVGLLLLETACNLASTPKDSSLAPVALVTSTVLPTYPPTEIPTPISTPVSTPAQAITPNPALWLTYTDFPTVTLEYPADWKTVATSATQSLWQTGFYPPNTSDQPIGFGVYHLPYEARAQADPHNQVGFVAILWEQPLMVDGAQGWMYVGSSGGTPDLNVKLYHPQHEILINMNTSLTEGIMKIAAGKGLTQTITQHFQTLETMAYSLRFPRPPATLRLPPTPISIPLPQPPVATSWLTYTLRTFSIQYPAEWQLIERPPIPPAVWEWGRFTLPTDAGVDIPANYAVHFRTWIYDESEEEKPAVLEPHAPYDPDIGHSVNDKLSGGEVLWQRPLKTSEGTGLIYGWGYPLNELNDEIALMAIYYNEAQTTELTLTT